MRKLGFCITAVEQYTFLEDITSYAMLKDEISKLHELRIETYASKFRNQLFLMGLAEKPLQP